MKQNGNRNVMVGTMRKSQAAVQSMWLLRKARQLWDGGPGRGLAMYLATVDSATAWPSSRSSACTQGVPQSGLFGEMRRFRLRISGSTFGRPVFLDF